MFHFQCFTDTMVSDREEFSQYLLLLISNGKDNNLYNAYKFIYDPGKAIDPSNWRILQKYQVNTEIISSNNILSKNIDLFVCFKTQLYYCNNQQLFPINHLIVMIL